MWVREGEEKMKIEHLISIWILSVAFFDIVVKTQNF